MPSYGKGEWRTAQFLACAREKARGTHENHVLQGYASGWKNQEMQNGFQKKEKWMNLPLPFSI